MSWIFVSWSSCVGDVKWQICDGLQRFTTPELYVSPNVVLFQFMKVRK